MVKRVSFSILLILLFTGCVTRYPMGLDEKTWNSLPAQKRLELQREQTRIDAEERLRRQKMLHEERMAQIELEKEKERKLKTLYERAVFGDIVRVNISGGCIQSYKECKEYRPVSLLLVVGETKEVKLKAKYDTLALWVRYDENGVTIDDDCDLDDLDAVLLLPERWERGRAYRISLKKPYSKGKFTLKNARVFVRYFPIATTTSNSRYGRR